jgi:hypothetical protein
MAEINRDREGVIRRHEDRMDVRERYGDALARFVGFMAQIDDHLGEVIAVYWGVPTERRADFHDQVTVRFDLGVKRQMMANIVAEVAPERRPVFTENGLLGRLGRLRNTLSHGWLVDVDGRADTVTLRTGRRSRGYVEEVICSPSSEWRSKRRRRASVRSSSLRACCPRGRARS